MAFRAPFLPNSGRGSSLVPGLNSSLNPTGFSGQGSTNLFGVGGLFDIESLGGTEGTLDIARGVNVGLAALASGLVQSGNLKAQAQVHRNNAADVRRAGILAVTSERRKGHLAIGAIRANAGFSGVTMSGSVMDVLLESSRNSARNAELIRWDYDSRANQLRYEAELADFNSDLSTLSGVAGILGAVGGGLSSAVQRT